MKRKSFLHALMSLLVLTSLILSACGTPKPTTVPATEKPTEPEPTATTAPAAADESKFEPKSVAAPDCSYGGKIKEIAAIDELTVKFSLCKPDPAFMAKIAFIPFAIQPEEWIEKTGGTGEILEKPIGTGPYQIDSWNRGDSVIFKSFNDYWGAKAKNETLVFRWATEGAARLLELQSGTVDYITNLSPDDFETVQNDPNLAFLPVSSANILYLAMTNTFEPFDNVKVRQAIAMGIDRQRIVDYFYPEGSEVASHFTPCSIPNGCAGESWYDFDPTAAKALLAEAGYPDGFKTSIYYRDVFRTYLPEPALVAVEFQTQLKENLGIDVDVIVMESGEFIDESTNGRLDGLYLLGWGADYPHPTNFLDFHFGASNPQFGDPHPEIYEVLEKASQIGNIQEAEPLYAEANNQIKTLVPMVPIAHGVAANAALASLDGAYTPPFGAPYFSLMDSGKDTLVFMQNAEPISLYCADETDGESLAPCWQVLEPLFRYKPDSGDVEPILATSCEPNAELTEWTCTLREGVKFHDGSDFDANDVIASWGAGIDTNNPNHTGNTGAFEYYSYLWDKLMDSSAAPSEDTGEDSTPTGMTVSSAVGCDYGGKVKEIAAIDDMTVKFSLCKPDPAFMAKIAFIPFAIQPEEWIEKTGGTGEILEKPIGTGPYQIDSWNRGDSVIFKSFNDYWGAKAKNETLVFRWATEGAARLLELQSGTVDYITNLSPDDFETVQNDPNLAFLPVSSANILYLAMTNTFEPFDNVKVRQAIAMGIDRQRIVDYFYPEGSEVASHFTPCSIPNGCAGESWYDFDPTAAKALLAEAGYPDGFKTSIYYRDVFRTYLPEPALVAVEFQTQLKENLGIDVDVIVMESGEFIDESTNGRLDGLYLLGWGADYPHPTNFLDFHFGASNPQFGDPHPEIYEVLEKASQIGNIQEAEPLYAEANNQIKTLVPMVPIAHGVAANAALASLDGAYTPPFGAPYFSLMDSGKDTLVFMQNAEPISLYCADETDGESLAPCWQVLEPLFRYKPDSGDVEPILATSCEPNAELTEWTCTLREGVKFHDGSDFDANDVIASWGAGIDTNNPNHTGNTGAFEYYSYLWDKLMNTEE